MLKCFLMTGKLGRTQELDGMKISEELPDFPVKKPPVIKTAKKHLYATQQQKSMIKKRIIVNIWRQIPWTTFSSLTKVKIFLKRAPKKVIRKTGKM